MTPNQIESIPENITAPWLGIKPGRPGTRPMLYALTTEPNYRHSDAFVTD